jgi:choline dehydrogenase-like flavoprotein
MIADLSAADGPTQLTCDLCVVGTGAAGLTIASEMLDASLNVVLVESGGLDFEPPTQSLYDVDISGLPHPGSTQGRFRVCGGSTTKWGGQALPLMPSDFKRREWVTHSGWPISFEEVSRYYPRACRFLSVDEKNFDTDLFSYLGARPPGFDVQRVWYHFSKWSPHPDLRQHYLGTLRNSKNCTLLLHANVTNIVLEAEFGRVRQLEVQSLDSRKATVRAKMFVLCVGGIESARLLLSNRRQRLNGIGNDFDLVGRFFRIIPARSSAGCAQLIRRARSGGSMSFTNVG